MRLAASLLVVTALTIPAVALASAAALQDELAAMDIQLSWSGEHQEAGRDALTAPTITGNRLRIEAEQLLYDQDTGIVTLIDARFLDQRGENDAQASAGEVIAQDVGSFHLVNETENCDPSATADLIPAVTEIRGLAVVPGQPSARRMSAESFSMERLVVRARVAADGSCITFDDAAMEGVTSMSPGGDTATIETVTLRTAYDGSNAAAFDLDLRNLAAFDKTGRSVASLGRMAFATTITGELPDSFPRDPGAAFDLLLRTSGNLDFEMRDLFLEAPDELGGQEMRGHAVARLRHGEEAIEADLDIDIKGLARLGLDLELKILPGDGSGGLSAMLGDQPGLAAAERLAVTRLRLAAADQGAVDIAEQTTGMGRDEILARLRAQLAVAPQVLVEPIMSFAAEVLDNGAGFRADPPQPVALTQIMMTGMLQPNMLGTILAISPE